MNKFLHGNGDPCGGCGGRGKVRKLRRPKKGTEPMKRCPVCGGDGRLARDPADVVAEAVAAARAVFRTRRRRDA